MGEKSGENDMEVTLNKQAKGQIFNNVTVGEYDVYIAFEGRTQSERERWYNRLIEMSKVAPMYAPILVREVMRHSDLPQKDRIIAELEQMQQQQAQMEQAGEVQNLQKNRGPIQSAPRPSRAPARTPANLQV